MVSLASPAGAMLPPVLPPQRPAYQLKRDSSYLDTDDEAGLSVSTKKLKVAFDPNVDIRIMDDWNEKSLDLVKEEVRIAIERHLAPAELRDDVEYAKLVTLLEQDTFSSEAPSAKMLKKYLVALDTRTSVLTGCGKLVMAVLDLAWLGRDEQFIALYTRVLVGLTSAHTKFVLPTMERLVSNFSKLPSTLGKLPNEQQVARTNMFARLHLIIRSLLRQVPSASGALLRALRFEFPNDLATTRSYIQYQKHLLRLADYVPEIKAEILALMTQRLVAVDVQIQQDIEELEEEVEERLLQRRSTQVKEEDDVDSDDSDADSVTSSEETITEEEMRVREIKLKVAKMDSTLDLLFQYYTPAISAGGRADVNEPYQQLLTHFGTYILPNRCRHSQFLLFHFSQTSSDFVSAFAECCLKLAFNHSGNSTHRFTACAYLSSFIARGSHIPAASVRDVVDILCHYLNDMCQRYEPTCRGPDKRAYSLYYAVAQALLYIFCFRWRDLVIGPKFPESGEDEIDDSLAEGRDLAWSPGVKESVTLNIYSRLNPLKVCSSAIVSEFARIANHLRFLYVFPLLESNKRLRLRQPLSYYGNGISGLDVGRRETAFDRKLGESHLQLEAYFPFDPYHLPKSKHWVEGDYNEWKLPAGMRQDEDEDDEDDYDDNESDYDSDEESLPGGVATGVVVPQREDNISVSS